MNLVVLTTQNHQQHKGKKKKKTFEFEFCV